MTKVLILSRNRFFTDELEGFFKAKGCEVLTSENSSSLNENIGYLVVVNLDGRFCNKSFIKQLDKQDEKLKVVVINSTTGIEGTTLPVKQIFVDCVIPHQSEQLRLLCKKALGVGVYLPTRAWMAVCSIEDLLNRVAEELFSFRDNKSILLGKLMSYRDIVNLVNPNAQIYIDINLPYRLPKPGLEVIETHIETGAIRAHLATPEKVAEIKPKPRFITRTTVAIISTLLFIIAGPYLVLAASGVSATIALSALKAGQIESAKPALSFAADLSKTSYRLLSAFRVLPLTDTAGVLSKGTALAGRVLAVSDYATEVTSGMTEGQDIAGPVQGLYLELSALYRDLSFLEDKNLPFANVEIDKYRGYVLAGSKLVRELPELLGFDRPKTYMVLLQNNMELRPTGGFIGSFALLTFSKGELIDNTVYDVYSADGQLKGYITPPVPIEEHLGEASWTLRDANWDPNFPKTAERVEWFLDKSIDREVDGVIGVNLEVAKKYLEVLGPLKLPDFEDTIDSKNMYEKVQFEVENDFFPGSRKKAHYLSALMNAIVSRIQSVSSVEAFKLLLATVESFDSRDIQVSLHNEAARQTFSQQKWDGGIYQLNACGENCVGLFAGLVEANLGVNKANYYITREVKLSTEADESGIEMVLALDLKNNAPGRERIPEQRYKAYVRAMASVGSEFVEAYEMADGKKNYFDVDIEEHEDRTDYGLLVEVLPGETKSIVFNWSTPVKLDFEKSGEINLLWWKQSGVGEYPFSIVTKLPPVNYVKSNPPSALTEQGAYIYNTTLNKDLISIFNWKEQ